MSRIDVLTNYQTWSDNISVNELTRSIQSVSADVRNDLRIYLDRGGYETAIKSGFGALCRELQASRFDSSRDLAEVNASITLGFRELIAGLDQLGADFNLALGDAIWRLELLDKRLGSILETLQAPLDTQAKELRRRAELAYRNGWYPEALSDFLESERKNYQDFAVHRSIANICLYYECNLDKAYEYYCKAAKYARPHAAAQAAEAEYFAARVAAFQGKLERALSHFINATQLNQRFSEAFYFVACVAAKLGRKPLSLEALTKAITADPRYHERATDDLAFADVQSEVQQLLSSMLADACKKVQSLLSTLDRAVTAELLPEDRKKLDAASEELRTKAKDASTYAGFVRLAGVFEGFAKDLADAEEREKKRREREVENVRYREYRLEQQKKEEVAKRDFERRWRLRQSNEAMISALKFSPLTYVVTGFVGCFFRFQTLHGPAIDPDYYTYPFRAWKIEALIIPAVFVVAAWLLAFLTYESWDEKEKRRRRP